MRGYAAGMGSVLHSGPVLFLLLAVCWVVGGGICYWTGRRVSYQEMDRRRAQVRAACEREAAERVTVPGQRAASS